MYMARMLKYWLLFTLVLYANGASAAILYSNDFQSGSTHEWLTDRKNGDKIEISNYRQNKSLLLKQAAFVVTPITTSGYQNVRFSATLYGVSLEKGGQCRAEVSADGGQSWHVIARLVDGQDDGLTPVFGKLFLTDADNQAQVLFRLLNTGDAAERCYFDNIKASGEQRYNLAHGRYGDGRFSYSFIDSGQDFSSPVPTQYFAKPEHAKPASNQFEGVLSYSGNEPQHLTLVDDLFSYQQEKDKKRYDQLPNFAIDFVQFGGDLIPVQRSPQQASHPPSHPYWEIMFEPGKVWDEAGDRGYSRAALPFALQEKGADCIHNGLMTFLFRSDGTVSRTLFQIGSETCAYFKFDMLGSLNVSYVPKKPPHRQAVIAAYQQEQAQRLPTKPITALKQRYPNVDLSGFGAANDVHPSVMTTYGVVIDGIHYVGACQTRFGAYPYCDVMDLPSYSTAKSINALAYMRMLKLFPTLGEQTIASLIPACDGKQWHDVSIENALNMSTGNYVSDGFEVDEYHSLRPFFKALTHADKTTAACRFERQARPGSKWVYHTSDSYLYATAINNFWKQQHGDDADYYDDLLTPIWDKLGLSPLMYRTRRTYDKRKQPYGGYGIIFHRGDVANLAHALLPNENNIDALSTMLEQTAIQSALQMNETDRGLVAMTDIKYKHAFWAWNVAPVLGCPTPTWIPFMSGYGGITIALLPNDIVYYYFSDNYDHIWLKAVEAAHKISPLCGKK